MILGVKLIDLAVVVGYFACVAAIGFWAARRVRDEQDFFLGGRKFGKGLLVMHWLCTGTHSDMAVQVAGATARVGLGGIWYQWMWLFSTPFYWWIAPVMRRLRVVTTGDFFRLRYGRGLEMLYTVVALSYLVLSIALLLRGAAAAISGATGGVLATNQLVLVLAVLFSSYILAGGLVAAAYTDFFQGVMIIILSVMLLPVGIDAIGGLGSMRQSLGPEMFAVTAPLGAKEGDPWFVIAMSLLGLAGVVAQPHVMTATASGKQETEARVGMCYGNFIKRLLTIAWAFTGLMAAVRFRDVLTGDALDSPAAIAASETLFGRAVQEFLGDGWRGLMIACIIAGVTSAETFMVVGAALFTRNLYAPVARDRSKAHYLWVGRLAAAGILAAGISSAVSADAVTSILKASIKVIGLLGPAFWFGVVWRRANASGVWASVACGLLVWSAASLEPSDAAGIPVVHQSIQWLHWVGSVTGLRSLSEPSQILFMLGAQCAALVSLSLAGRSHAADELDEVYARLLTPVGCESDVALSSPRETWPERATLGHDGPALDYRRARRYGNQVLRRWDIELPRFHWFDWAGFALAWLIVFLFIALLVWLAQLAR
jgi:Na+/proline symporter